jgi:hypothetical protein
MANITNLRSGIKTNLQTITGLRVADTIPDQINPPIALVELQTVDFDKAMHHGTTAYNFRVVVLVARQSERSGQNKLDAYVASTGSASVKLAIESDRTLSVAAFDCFCQGVTSYGVTSVGEVNYLSAEFQVLVYAS